MSEPGLCRHTYSEDLLHTTVSAPELLPLIRLSFISHLFLSDFDFFALLLFFCDHLHLYFVWVGFNRWMFIYIKINLVHFINIKIEDYKSPCISTTHHGVWKGHWCSLELLVSLNFAVITSQISVLVTSNYGRSTYRPHKSFVS